MIKKQPYIVLMPFVLWCFFICILYFWLIRVSREPVPFPWLAWINFSIWLIILYWTLHHISFQIVALFQNNSRQPRIKHNSDIVILYLTCDDFIEECCQSCLEQDYKNCRVIICDDSKSEEFKKKVDGFYSVHQDKCIIVRRKEKTGFKAGNLNNVINNFVKEEWICIVDADQYLPKNYISKLICYIPDSSHTVSYIQSANNSYINVNSSFFQKFLSYENAIFYFRTLPLRNTFGFVPFLGHGVIFSRAAWKQLGGFPEVVSEDLAFAMRASGSNLKGIYIDEIISNETFPNDFGSFVIRLKKFAGGASELIRKELLRFLVGSSSLTEKWDLLMMLLGYLILPMLVINSFISAYVSNILWVKYYPYIHPVLPYIYFSLFISAYTIIKSIDGQPHSPLKFYFWSTAVYISAMPVVSFAFLKGLFIKPVFISTPKGPKKIKLKIAESIFTLILGVVALICSFLWLSPFTPYLLGLSSSFLLFPFFQYLNDNNIRGKISRKFIYLPGLFMVFALITFWYFGK
jgi:cellulose synthase/poly-beta-1,6-N-acetylglucosamine synthase-like glycosyltransferase